MSLDQGIYNLKYCEGHVLRLLSCRGSNLNHILSIPTEVVPREVT